jgi:uncharacterized membrane protein
VRYRAALCVITLCGFALRTYGLHHQSFWLDEVDAIAFAAEPVLSLVRKFARIGENGPLYFLLFKGWVTLAGTSEFGARFLSAAASTAVIPLVGQVAYRLFRCRDTALVAAALAALSPYYVWYGQDAKMYPLYAILALAAQYCLLRAVVPGRPRRAKPASGGAGDVALAPRPAASSAAGWWTGYVGCSSLALYVHRFAALQIAANTVAGAWTVSRRRSGWRGFAIATALLVAPYVPLAVWQGRVLLAGADVGYRPASLWLIVSTLLWQFVWHLNRAPVVPLVVVAGAALLWGLWRTAVPEQRARGALSGTSAAGVLACWLVVPVLGTLALQGTVPVFRDRYLIPLLAPMLVLFARAIVPLARPASPASLATSVFLGVSFGYGLLHRPPNPDFRAAAAFVRSQTGQSGTGTQIGFLAEYAERPFAFYYRRGGATYQKATLPYTNYPNMSEQEGLLAVARSLRGGRTLWVVRFEDWLWDGRDLARQYLANRGLPPLLREDFDGVTVEEYVLP